jgi:FixJ family two-component response regulator
LEILLVDDDPAFRSGLASIFREDGHEVLDYDDPSKLPAYDTLGHVSLLLTDYQMPVQDGLSLADEFHAAHPEVPVILITGCSEPRIDDEASRRGFLHVLHKPVTYGDVHDMVHRLTSATE